MLRRIKPKQPPEKAAALHNRVYICLLLTLMKGDKVVEAVKKFSYFLLFIYRWHRNFNFNEIGFVNSPLPVDYTLTPFYHRVDKVFSD